jgi:two-component system response regulator (stage 0 sporulation protein F)
VPTVLIVDDDRGLRELYKSELSLEGYEVMAAATGKEAVEILKDSRPDVIVMDIRMPEMDGIEALGKVVARHKNIPVIINTAYPSYQEDFRAWAADEYVVKSSDLTELKAAIKRVLERSRPKAQPDPKAQES